MPDIVWNRKTDPIWWGLFLDDQVEGVLGCYPQHGQHITFGYKDPVSAFEDEIPWGETFEVLLVGYANDGMNEGFLCEIPDELSGLYHSPAPPHITVSFENGAHPVDTGYMVFEPLGTPRVVYGRLGQVKDGTVSF